MNGNLDQLLALLEQARLAPVKAIDIETSTLRPYATDAKMLSVAISFGSTNFSFALDHPKAGWSPHQKHEIDTALCRLLVDDTTKVGHNSTFECEWFAQIYGPECINQKAWECTQLQAHFLDERRGDGRGDDETERRATYLSLDFLVKMHFGFSFKKLFKVNRKRMIESDLDETLIYNGADTKFTLKLWHHQNRLLKDAGLYESYLRAVPRQAVCGLMQHFGMEVDQNAVKELQKTLGEEITAIESDIYNLEVIKQYIKDRGSFNPLGDDALVVFRDYLKREEIKVQDGKHIRWSIDKHILEKIDHPLAQLIVRLRNKTKMKSTYVDGLELGKGEAVWPDNKIHCHFNTCFTTTGRLSSDSPNMQNFPHRADSWARKQIVAPPGHYIIAADYGQLEACCAAMCSRDPVFIKALWEDTDVHMEWSERLNKLDPNWVSSTFGDFNDIGVAKLVRSFVKNKMVFPAIYGATNGSIASYLGINLDVVDELMVDFWDVFAGLKHWQDALMRGYYDNGYVESPSGRCRHYPLSRNEAINAPIQCLASDIVVDSMCRLSSMASQTKKWWLHPRLNIHDDLSFVVPDEHMDKALDTIIKTMLTLQFDCINVPLSISVSIGRNWYEMHDVGKFFSHKDI